MRFVICVTCVALLTLVIMATGAPVNSGTSKPKPQYDLENAPALFEKFIKDYDKTYKDEEDKKVHYEVFVKSLESINRLNSDPNRGSATFDINHLADYTETQRKSLFGFKKP